MARQSTLVWNTLQNERPWLVTMHCVSHRVELAIKDSLCKQPQFESVKDFMIELYYYTKRTGKFVHHLNVTAEALGTKPYKQPKVHGTRFVNHQRRGVDVLLHNWLILLQSIENTLATQKKQEPKLLGYLKKLKNFTFLSHCCLYKAVLEIVASLSLQFEKGALQIFEIDPEIRKTLQQLSDLQDQDADYFLQKAGFSIDGQKLTCPVLKAGHRRKKMENRESVELSFDKMTNVGDWHNSVNLVKTRVTTALTACLNQRFASFQRPLFQQCHWMDAANWTSEEEEIEDILEFSDHFEVPLQSRGFEKTKIRTEWKILKQTVETFYKRAMALDMWEKILNYRRDRFPDVCLLVELVMCLGMSNSVVEGGFSHLTRMLPDTRLSMNHSTMENLLLIKLNDLVLSKSDKTRVIEFTLDKFMSTRRKSKLDTFIAEQLPEAGPSRTSLEESHQDNSDSDSDSSSYMSYDSDTDFSIET